LPDLQNFLCKVPVCAAIEFPFALTRTVLGD